MTLKKTSAFNSPEQGTWKSSEQNSKRIRLTDSVLNLAVLDFSDSEEEAPQLPFGGYSSEPEPHEPPDSPSKKARAHPYLARLKQRIRTSSTSSIKSIENQTNPFMKGASHSLNGYHNTILQTTKGTIHWVAIVHQHQEVPPQQDDFASPQTPEAHATLSPQTPPFSSPPQIQEADSPHTPGESSEAKGKLSPTHAIKKLMARHTLVGKTNDGINTQIEASIALLKSKGFPCLDRTYCGEGYSISPYLENEVDVAKFNNIGFKAITTFLNMLLEGQLALAQFPDISASNIRTKGQGDTEEPFFCDFLEFPRNTDDFECDFGTIYRSWKTGFTPEQSSSIENLKTQVLAGINTKRIK